MKDDEGSAENRIQTGAYDDPLDLGFTANRCTAADVECLRQFRKNKLYRSHARSWGVFCPRYLGFSRTLPPSPGLTASSEP